MLLFSLKVRYPNRIHLLRGNHESRFLSRSYVRVLCITHRFGFYQQCLNYYGNDSVWNEFMKAFDCLPLCAVVNKHVFAVHAGISPKLQFIHDIDVIDRFQEIPVISFASWRHHSFIPRKACFATSSGRTRQRRMVGMCPRVESAKRTARTNRRIS